jgi:hypothetical protein
VWVSCLLLHGGFWVVAHWAAGMCPGFKLVVLKVHILLCYITYWSFSGCLLRKGDPLPLSRLWMWPHVNQVKIYNTSWNSKNKEARREWACSKRKKTFRSPYFQISYLLHFLFVLNNLKSYGSVIWSFTKPFWSAKTIEWCPKILSFRMQTGHMCQPTCPWPPSLGEGIYWSFLHWFEWFLLQWMCHLKVFKKLFEVQRQ